MSNGLTDLAFFIKTATHSTQYPISLSHSQQLISAALGFASFAAYQAHHRDDLLILARQIVFNDSTLKNRINQLQIEMPEDDLTQIMVEAFNTKMPYIKIHDSFESYAHDVEQELMKSLIQNKDIVEEAFKTEFLNFEYVFLDKNYVQLAPLMSDYCFIPIEGYVLIRANSSPLGRHEIHFRLLLDTHRYVRGLHENFVYTIQGVNLDAKVSDDI